MNRWKFWRNWVIANAAGELLGLGIAALVMLALSRTVPPNPTTAALLAGALIMVFFGALEGAIVGYAQWIVLRRTLAVAKSSWILTTAIAAAVAWLLGLLPSSIVNVSPTTAPSLLVTLFLSMGVGAVSGVILAIGQTWILHRYSRIAGWWLVANAGAWAVGMPIIFFSAGLPTPQTPIATVILLLLTTVLVAGAAVGAIHGAVLLRILERTRQTGEKTSESLAAAA